MFSNCIHCTADLGRNEAFESFPVGTRLAFDPARGRLWVICRGCGRWNLSPLEERWETVEAAEGRFRESRLRVSTDEIGLAHLREGIELIRIGSPLRPEMAAWRYGDQFGRRRKRQLLVSGAVVGSVVGIVGGMMAVGVSVGSFAGVYANGAIWDALIHGRQSKSIGKIALPDGRLVDVHRRHARMSAFERSEPGGPLQLRLESTVGSHLLVGEEVMRVAARLLPTVNRFGGSRAQVQDAVQLLQDIGDPMAVMSTIQQQHGRTRGDKTWADKGSWGAGKRHTISKLPGTLHTLAPRERLAIEMAVHEARERLAMQGELQALEQAWREAEQIAKIADDMFLPPTVEIDLARLRNDARRRED